MGVEINGLNNIEKFIKRRYSSKVINKVEERALNQAGAFISEKVKSNLESVKGETGYLADGTSFRPAEIIQGDLSAKVYWNGPHLSLAHLNENGHYDKAGKWVKPNALGMVNNTLALNKEKYFDILKKEMNK